MTNPRQKLIEAAEKAIDDLFSDTSVTQSETAADLRDLIDNIRQIHMNIRSMGK